MTCPASFAGLVRWLVVLISSFIRNRAASVMQAGKNGVARSTGSGIDERPEIVDQRSRLGDWEGGTVMGKNHQGAWVTLAERRSRYFLAGHVRSKHFAGVAASSTPRLMRV
jgi:IS30 family transposase